MLFTVTMRDNHGATEHETIEAGTVAEAWDAARDATEAWCEGGDWGDDGAIVECFYSIDFDNSDPTPTDEQIEDEEREVTVSIDVDHASLISSAAGTRYVCGLDPDDHEWTSKGEGGCDDNPGVWSLGGTALAFSAHCKVCGLRRSEHKCGSQRNPGERDTVTYEMPEPDEDR